MTTRREFVAAIGFAGASGLISSARAPAQVEEPKASAQPEALRVCFLTDAHLPHANDVARLTNDQFHHQKRVRAAFDRANEFKPDVFIFGGDNVFAVDQEQDGGHLEPAARAQFDNWKGVVNEKVRVPHHSVIGNHDLWLAHPQGMNAKTLAIAGFEMPNRFYSWKMKGWKFLMLDVFGVKGSPIDKEQWDWLANEIKEELSTCVVTHAPILSVTGQIIGGTVKEPRTWRELFYQHPHVRLALSGHNHMLDLCTMDRVTYVCGGAVSGGWWEGAYQHFPPMFITLELFADGSFKHTAIEYEGPASQFKQMD